MKTWLIVVICCVLLVSGGVALFFTLRNDKDETATPDAQTNNEKSITTYDINAVDKIVLIKHGENYTLSPTTSNKPGDSVVSFQSLNTSIATVSAQGEVAPIGVGETFIKSSFFAEGETYSCSTRVVVFTDELEITAKLVDLNAVEVSKININEFYYFVATFSKSHKNYSLSIISSDDEVDFEDFESIDDSSVKVKFKKKNDLSSTVKVKAVLSCDNGDKTFYSRDVSLIKSSTTAPTPGSSPTEPGENSGGDQEAEEPIDPEEQPIGNGDEEGETDSEVQFKFAMPATTNATFDQTTNTMTILHEDVGNLESISFMILNSSETYHIQINLESGDCIQILEKSTMFVGFRVLKSGTSVIRFTTTEDDEIVGVLTVIVL